MSVNGIKPGIFGTKFSYGSILGVGAYSAVRFAKTKKTETNPVEYEVAIKITDLSKVKSNFSLTTEMDILSVIDHENIVKLYEVHLAESQLYLVLEYIPGRNLYYYIEFLYSFPVPDLAKMMYDLASALDYLHKHNIVHKDINPKNLLVDVDDCLRVKCLKVVDFNSSVILTRPQNNIEKRENFFQYLAPEQRFSGQLGCKVDIWAAGVVFCYLIFGLEICKFDFAAHELDFKFPPECIPNWFNLTFSLKHLLKGMLAKDVRKRYTAQDILNHLFIKIFHTDPLMENDNLIDRLRSIQN